MTIAFTVNKTCQHCRQPFAAMRSSARFCGAACRKAANRGESGSSLADRRAPNATEMPVHAPVSVTSTFGATEAQKAAFVTLRNLPEGIVPDERWLGMYRALRPDGSLSDLVNLTRAKDALRAQQEREREARRKGGGGMKELHLMTRQREMVPNAANAVPSILRERFQNMLHALLPLAVISDRDVSDAIASARSRIPFEEDDGT